MKKQYMKPEQKVVLMKTRLSLLSASDLGLAGFHGRATNDSDVVEEDGSVYGD